MNSENSFVVLVYIIKQPQTTWCLPWINSFLSMHMGNHIDKYISLVIIMLVNLRGIRIRTTPQEDNSPPYRFWSWCVVLFRGSGTSGELSWWAIVLYRDCGPGGQWLGFIFIWWGIVLMGSCPRTDIITYQNMMQTVLCHTTGCKIVKPPPKKEEEAVLSNGSEWTINPFMRLYFSKEDWQTLSHRFYVKPF